MNSGVLKWMLSASASNGKSIMSGLCSVGSQDESSQLYLTVPQEAEG